MHYFTNGTFLSCEAENQTYHVMGVEKGRIRFLGDRLPAGVSAAETTDLNGQCVVPAFADTHIHFASFALFNETVDVREAADFDDMGRRFACYQAAHPKVKFIPAFGCSAHTVAEKRLPGRKDFDKMTNLPALMVKYDGHAGVANTALIHQLPDAVKQDPGFDAGTGWLYQNAFYLAVNFITQKIAPLKILQNFINAADFMARRGIGLIHTVEGVGYRNDLDVDTVLIAARALPQTFRVFFQTMDLAKVSKRRLPRVGGCFRLALDGCFGSEDAALLEPYANDNKNRGFLAYTQEQVTAFCTEANRKGLQISMHAIGDAAVEQALTAYEAALTDTPRADHRHIIIHGDLMPAHMIKRAAALGVLIAVQPAFLDWRQEPQSYLDTILGEERAGSMLPLKSWVDHGIVLSAGSDAPCTLPDPVRSIALCCNHPNPAQRLEVLDALRMHTAWAAYTSFDERERGTLQNGLCADFVVLNQNPLEMPAASLPTLQVTDVYFGGRRYCKPLNGPLALACKALFTGNHKGK